MEALCKKRSSLIYEVIDASHGFYTNTIHPSLRSTTNVVFTLENKDRETEFLEFAESKKLVSLKGHTNI